MSKVKTRCTDCGKIYKTGHPEIKMRFCKNCNHETEFELVTEKPVTRKNTPFDIMCLRCQTVYHVQSIPKRCGCGQRFQRHAENTTLTDVIYNIIVGTDKTEKGYMKVTVGRDGQVWWTPEKDAPGDGFPFIGDAQRTSHYSNRGETIDELLHQGIPSGYPSPPVTEIRKTKIKEK